MEGEHCCVNTRSFAEMDSDYLWYNQCSHGIMHKCLILAKVYGLLVQNLSDRTVQRRRENGKYFIE